MRDLRGRSSNNATSTRTPQYFRSSAGPFWKFVQVIGMVTIWCDAREIRSNACIHDVAILRSFYSAGRAESAGTLLLKWSWAGKPKRVGTRIVGSKICSACISNNLFVILKTFATLVHRAASATNYGGGFFFED